METDWALWAIYLKRGEGQKRAAKRLGIGEGNLTHMIFKNAAPSIATLIKIAAARSIETRRSISAWELMKEAEQLTLTQNKKAEHSLEERSA